MANYLDKMFIGKIVAWPNAPEEAQEPSPLTFAGHGEIVGVISHPECEEPYLLVRCISSTAIEGEPPFEFTVNALLPSLQFFTSFTAYREWYEWLMSQDPDKKDDTVVRLAAWRPEKHDA